MRFTGLSWAIGLLLATLTTHAVDWRIGDQVYHKVVIKEVTPRAVIILHSKGITQIPLADLPPEAQKKFGYDPEAAAADEQRAEREHAKALQRKAKLESSPSKPKPWSANSLTTELALAFRQNPEVKSEVDLRPELRELGLFSKSQGRRPSCSIFAIVGALEFQASKEGKPVQFSEDYAIWATRQYLADQQSGRSADYGEGDAGFALIDVINALAQYGLVPYDEMPNTFGSGMERIEPPEPALLKQAKRSMQLNALRMDSGNPNTSINHIVHALNRGLPVIIGVAWPHENTLRSAPMISGQNPVSMHAVTLVGYRSNDDGENLRFVFKNSWGPLWGSGGYGWITADYLKEHLSTAYVLDPQFL
ncbi:C1 family peptidase [Cerasicoccus maritimus]|uniref:C1 family peptidase n=1 Tax=Cerasicoccus maritimus TaxID=490089 RepID=UPI002852CCA2|nr:C1 family peptidase [Cerasicoccus maritimus]